MVQLTELGFAGASAALVVNALLDSPQVWVLFVCSIVMAALDGLQRPSLDGLVPRLVERDELPAAGALSSFRMTIGMVAGPAIGGVLIATIGLPLTYGVDVATFLFSLAVLRLMRAVPPRPAPRRRPCAGSWRACATRAAAPDLLGTYIVDIVAMFFGMPMALFPAIAEGSAAPARSACSTPRPSVGSLIATVSSGWTANVRRHGRAICLAAAGWGVADRRLRPGGRLWSPWCSWRSPAART